ncbi:hypothetical protein [Pelagicoccus mobilis]|uniref:Serine kinase n=1 Tax=Pelagicoccus mobilis TaxID=415221 RepID=A0A934RSK6_9BACT|nr:hypothetical protein [Pelagicoccus mobilis]MBK1875653.1 hypothetical protein [Pelagicoccus mobilis]
MLIGWRRFMWRYRAYSLIIESEIELPELSPAESSESVDLTIRIGEVPVVLQDPVAEGARFQAAPGVLLVVVDGVGRFLARDGETIIVDRESGTTDSDIRLFLLGTMLGGVLQQRGILTLHGSVVDSPQGAVAILGHSGAGKSTTAYALHERGFSLVSDDLCAVRLNDAGEPRVFGGYPQFKLWPDSLAAFELGEGDLRRVRPVLEKRAVPCLEEISTGARRLKRVFVLSESNSVESQFREIQGFAKIDRLKEQIYRRQFLMKEAQGKVFETLAALGGEIRMYEVLRPRGDIVLERFVDEIVSRF